MPARFFVDHALSDASAQELVLPAATARHVQVLRLQPGEPITLFDGSGQEWHAELTAMGRAEVRARLISSSRPARELGCAVMLAVVMPANDRMDFLVEKATELGAATLQPLQSERSVLRLSGERAAKKQLHWQGVAIASAEQCGRTVPTRVAPLQPLSVWLAALPAVGALHWRGLLSPRAAAPLAAVLAAGTPGEICLLSGPEGGLSDAEEQAALAQGFAAFHLGPRILRADTAPLAALAYLGQR